MVYSNRQMLHCNLLYAHIYTTLRCRRGRDRMVLNVQQPIQSVPIPLRWGVLDTTLCDKVFHWLTASHWFSQDTSVASTNKTDRHDITEILLKVALSTINHKTWCTNLTCHICVAVPSQNLDFQRSTSWYFLWSRSWGERWLFVLFILVALLTSLFILVALLTITVYISGIVDHHCLY